MATREEKIKEIQKGIEEAKRLADLATRQSQADIAAGGKQEFKPGTAEPIRPLPSLATTGKSSLVEFADVLSQITDLARRKHQRITQEVLFGAGFVPGAVEPNTFSSILKNVEQATQRGFEESLKTAKELLPKEQTLTGDIREFQDAKRLGLIEEKTDFFDYLKRKGEAERKVSQAEQEKPLDILDIGRYGELYPEAGVTAGDTKIIADQKVKKLFTPQEFSDEELRSFVREFQAENTSFEDVITEIQKNPSIGNKERAEFITRELYGKIKKGKELFGRERIEAQQKETREQRQATTLPSISEKGLATQNAFFNRLFSF